MNMHGQGLPDAKHATGALIFDCGVSPAQQMNGVVRGSQCQTDPPALGDKILSISVS